MRVLGRILVAILAALNIGIPLAAQRPALSIGRSGFEAIAGGRPQEAATIFEEALKVGPQEPLLLFGAGVAAHMLGRADESRRYLVTALKYDPRLTAASLVLGDVLYRAGDLAGAIETYELALTYAPDHAQLSRRLETWRKELELHGRFGQRFGDHFTVLFEGPAEAELAQRAVTILESAYWRIGTALFTYPTDTVTVVLYTREQFRDITQSPEWAGGAFDGRIRIPVQGALQNSREFERVLTHEFTHALVRSIAPRNVPFWLDEGLAVRFEGSDLAHEHRVVAAARGLIPLQKLEKSFSQLDATDARLAYAQSVVAVEHLLADAGPAALVNLLTDLGSGIPFAEAFERHMLVPYLEFQRRLSGSPQQ